MTLSKYAKPIFFALSLLLIIIFYVWSGLFWTSLILFYVADFMSIGYCLKFLKKHSPKISYYIFKYVSYIIIPVFFSVFIRTFFFDIYYVPSSSMERTLSPDDYVLVNKFVYGPKVPNRRRDIPVVGKLFSSKSLEVNHYNLYESLKGFQIIKRDDIVVFKSVEDRNKFLVKRVIGLPGEKLKIIESEVYINDKILSQKEEYCYNYTYSVSDNDIKMIKTLSNKEYNTIENSKKIKLKKHIKDNMQLGLLTPSFNENKKWTIDNYDEIIVPKKGLKIKLYKNNYSVYKSTLERFENVNFNIRNNETLSYTFKNDYYFMMGDNRHNSTDSRSYGFIPNDYIQGKVILKF